MYKKDIINFVKNSKKYETLTLKNEEVDGYRIIESIYHCGDDGFDYSVDKIETAQIVSFKSVKNLKNIDDIMEVLKW